MERSLLASAAALPVVVAAAVTMKACTDEGRWDSYVFGGSAVILAIAALLHQRSRIQRRWARWLCTAAGVAAMPLVAGFATGLALALVHPRFPAGETEPRAGWASFLLGGALRGATGGAVLYPGLLPAAVLAFTLSWAMDRRRHPPAMNP